MIFTVNSCRMKVSSSELREAGFIMEKGSVIIFRVILLPTTDIIKGGFFKYGRDISI